MTDVDKSLRWIDVRWTEDRAQKTEIRSACQSDF